MINTDPHNQREKGYPVPAPQRETMWVHPDIVKSQQWTIITSRKSRGKAKVPSSNVMSISTKETEEDVTSFNSSRDEESAFIADDRAKPAQKNIEI